MARVEVFFPGHDREAGYCSSEKTQHPAITLPLFLFSADNFHRFDVVRHVQLSKVGNPLSRR